MQDENWHKERAKGIGSSDIAAVMGVSPWLTPYQLWLQKKGRGEPQKDNYAMARGREFEHVVREFANKRFEASFEPRHVVHPELEYLRANLDGISAQGVILEIKVAKIPEKAPIHYDLQVRHQLLCTPEAPHGILFYYDPDTQMSEPFFIERDPKREKEILDAAKAFWTNHVLADVAPELAQGDYVECQDAIFEIEAQAFKEARRRLEVAEATMEEARMALEHRLGDNPGLRGFGLRLSRYTRRGNVDYSKIEALKGLNLEPYRKKPITAFKILEEK